MRLDFLGRLALPALALTLVAPRALGWSTSPSVDDPVASGIYYHKAPTIVSAGTGLIAAWEYTAADDIRAQHLDATGARSWTSSGVVVCNATGSQTQPRGVPDGSGGAIVVWRDQRTTPAKLYAQRVLPGGSMAWANNGVLVSSAAGVFDAPVVAGDGAGGVLVAAKRTATDGAYAQVQRLDGDGNRLWGTAGVTVSGMGVGTPAVESDGAGGAFVAWTTNGGLFAQHMDATGAPQWGAGGVVVSTEADVASDVALTHDGAGGVHVLWPSPPVFPLVSSQAYARKLSAAGARQGDAVIVLPYSSVYRPPKSIPDGSGGAVMAWAREAGLYAQRLDTSGQPVWGNGVALGSVTPYYDHAVVKTLPGNFMVVWSRWKTSPAGVFAQNLTPAGDKSWPAGAVLASTASDVLPPISLAPFATGAVVAFSNLDVDVRAKLVNGDGTLGVEVDAGLDGGADAGAGGADSGAAGASGGGAGSAGAAGGAAGAGGAGTSGGAGAGGGGAGAGEGGGPGKGGSATGGGAGTTGGSGDGGPSDAGAAPGGGSDGGGCGCAAPGRRSSAGAIGAFFVGLLVARERRRRRASSTAESRAARARLR
jgi:hypothetical protein